MNYFIELRKSRVLVSKHEIKKNKQIHTNNEKILFNKILQHNNKTLYIKQNSLIQT